MIIHPDSHLDHGLSPDHIAHILGRFAAREAFFIETFELPPDLPAVPCGLYGPLVGDAPIPSALTIMLNRPGRAYDSRVLVAGNPRPSRLVTVIAGPHDGAPCVLFTAFGGPLAPKEPGDPTLKDDERAESIAFWAEHALAFDPNTHYPVGG